MCCPLFLTGSLEQLEKGCSSVVKQLLGVQKLLNAIFSRSNQSEGSRMEGEVKRCRLRIFGSFCQSEETSLLSIKELFVFAVTQDVVLPGHNDRE